MAGELSAFWPRADEARHMYVYNDEKSSQRPAIGWPRLQSQAPHRLRDSEASPFLR